MLDTLQDWDAQAFYWINQKLSHWFLDVLMPSITDLHKEPLFIFGVLPLVLGFWLFKQKSYGLKVLLGFALCIGATDNINSKVLKPYFNRQRPTETQMNVKARSRHDHGLSFPSTHAANNFAGAIFLSLIYPGAQFSFLLIAFLVAYSRVYVGVHYPLDVLAGGIWASLFAYFFAQLWMKWVLNPKKKVPILRSDI